MKLTLSLRFMSRRNFPIAHGLASQCIHLTYDLHFFCHTSMHGLHLDASGSGQGTSTAYLHKDASACCPNPSPLDVMPSELTVCLSMPISSTCLVAWMAFLQCTLCSVHSTRAQPLACFASGHCVDQHGNKVSVRNVYNHVTSHRRHVILFADQRCVPAWQQSASPECYQ